MVEKLRLLRHITWKVLRTPATQTNYIRMLEAGLDIRFFKAPHATSICIQAEKLP